MPDSSAKSPKEVVELLMKSGYSEDQARALAPSLGVHTCLGCPSLRLMGRPMAPQQMSPTDRPTFGNAEFFRPIAVCACMPGDQPDTWRYAWGRCPLYGLTSIQDLIQKQEALENRVQALEGGGSGRSLVTVQSSRIAERGNPDEDEEDD